MTLEELSAQIPEYAKDMRVNLSNVLQQPELNEQQLWGSRIVAMSFCEPRSW